MEKAKNYIVGFDLGNKYAQISFVSFEEEEGDVYNIPVCLCKRTQANQWYYGVDAQKAGANNKGTLVDDLLEKAIKNDPVQVEDIMADPVELLALFIRNCLAGLGFYKSDVCVKSLVISVDNLSKEMLIILNRIKKGVLSGFENVFFEPKLESLFSYIVHQPKELRCYELGVIDLSEGFLKFYHIQMSNRSKPILTTIDEFSDERYMIPDEFPSIMEKDRFLDEMDEKLADIMTDFLENRLVTVFYLIGKIFDREWCPKTIKVICHNRRVFGGSNLYSKGACLLGLDKIDPPTEPSEYLYLGKEKIRASVGVLTMSNGKSAVKTIIEGGKNWFEVKKSFDFMPGEDGKLPIVVQLLGDQNQRMVPVVLPVLADRDPKSTKFHCTLSFKSVDELVVSIEDIGFGEFYKPTGKKYQEIISVK